MSAMQMDEDSTALRPGEAYTIYQTQDLLGSLSEDLETITRHAASWAGVDEDYISGVVERYEHRFARWWVDVRRREKAETGTEANSENEHEVR